MSGRRRTSLEAYRQILETGVLGKAAWKVYDALFQSASGLTRNELDRTLAPGKPNAIYSRRLTELERRGVVWRNGTRECAVTGKVCDVWDVTDVLPTRPVRPPKGPQMPSAEDAARLVAHVDARIESFRLIGLETPPELEVLRAWLAAGAPRCGRAPTRGRDPVGPGRDRGPSASSAAASPEPEERVQSSELPLSASTASPACAPDPPRAAPVKPRGWSGNSKQGLLF